MQYITIVDVKTRDVFRLTATQYKASLGFGLDTLNLWDIKRVVIHLDRKEFHMLSGNKHIIKNRKPIPKGTFQV